MDVFSLPTVEQLKIKLGIEDPGRGNVHPGYASMGIHVDDYEAQHAMLNEHGEVMFNTGIEMPDMVYRGQVQEFSACYRGWGDSITLRTSCWQSAVIWPSRMPCAALSGR